MHFINWVWNKMLMPYLGKILFYLGLSLALLTASKLPVSAPWPDTWPVYVISILLSLTGLWLLRVRQQPKAIQQERTAPDIVYLSNRLETEINCLQKDLDLPEKKAANQLIERILNDTLRCVLKQRDKF